MSDYRTYIFGKDGHRFLKVPEFSSDHRETTRLLWKRQKGSSMDTTLSCGKPAAWFADLRPSNNSQKR